MNIPNVLFGIATIWEALRNEGILYAYAGEEIFEETLRAEVDTGILDLEFGVVGGPNDFIMPILFPHPDAYCQATTSNQGKGKDGKKADKATTTNRNKAEGKSKRKSKSKDKDEDDKSPIGHLVLAVARRPSRDSNKFDIEIRDTRLRTVDREKIRQRAQTIATMSGWITGIDEFQRPRQLQRTGMAF